MSEAHSSSQPAPLPAEGTEDGERLRRAQAAFDRGDFRRVRELTDQLAAAADREVAQQAANLARAVHVDPVAVAVLSVCLIGFCAVAYHYLVAP